MGEDKGKNIFKPTELCELYFIKAAIYEDKGEVKQAIKFMTKKSITKALIDDVRRNEILTRLYMKQG